MLLDRSVGRLWSHLLLMKKVTPAHAVARGHLTVTLPVLVIIMLGGVIGSLISDARGFLFGLIVGAVLAWPCWSFLVPRWRDWVEDEGLDPGEVQPLAVSTGLLWPRGSLFERTECKRRNGKRGW